MNNPIYRISDMGATQKYIKVNTPCAKKVKTTIGPKALLPDGRLVQATHRAEINVIPLLSTRAKTSHIFPYLQSGALLSIFQPCDDICTSTLTATYMRV